MAQVLVDTNVVELGVVSDLTGVGAKVEAMTLSEANDPMEGNAAVFTRSASLWTEQVGCAGSYSKPSSAPPPLLLSPPPLPCCWDTRCILPLASLPAGDPLPRVPPAGGHVWRRGRCCER